MKRERDLLKTGLLMNRTCHETVFAKDQYLLKNKVCLTRFTSKKQGSAEEGNLRKNMICPPPKKNNNEYCGRLTYKTRDCLVFN